MFAEHHLNRLQNLNMENKKTKQEKTMNKIYCYPKCTTCQRAIKWLNSKAVEYQIIDIKENNPDKETLRSLWQKSGLELKKFFNTSGLLYKQMQLSQKLAAMTDEQKLDLLSSDGMLVKRPILITQETVLVGFKESEWNDAIGENSNIK